MDMHERPAIHTTKRTVNGMFNQLTPMLAKTHLAMERALNIMAYGKLH